MREQRPVRPLAPAAQAAYIRAVSRLLVFLGKPSHSDSIEGPAPLPTVHLRGGLLAHHSLALDCWQSVRNLHRPHLGRGVLAIKRHAKEKLHRVIQRIGASMVQRNEGFWTNQIALQCASVIESCPAKPAAWLRIRASPFSPS